MNRFTKHTACVIVAWALLISCAFAATWTGSAQDVPQRTEVAVAGTWAPGDTATISCNAKSVIVTAGASMDTPAEVAAGLAAAINLDVHDDATVSGLADMQINFGGQEFGEFRDMVASAEGTVLVLTSAIPGVPFTINVDNTGSGTVGATTPQQATGGEWFNNAQNWMPAVVPVAGESLLFNSGSTSVKYGLDTPAAELSLERTDEYTGSIGLPRINAGSGMPYTEYRDTFLELPNLISTGDQHHQIGTVGGSAAGGITRIDCGTVAGIALRVTVNNAPMPRRGEPGVQIRNGKATAVAVYRGSIELGMDATPTGITSLQVSASDTSSAWAKVGASAVWDGAAKLIDVSGGTAEIQSASGAPIAAVHSGELMLDAGTTGEISSCKVYGGTLKWVSGVFTPEIYSGGTVDMRVGNYLMTNASQPVFYTGYKYLDPRGRATWTNGIDFQGCTPATPGSVFDVLPSQNWKASGL